MRSRSIGEPPRTGGYRVAGDIEVRLKELEAEVTELRARYREADRERWRARRSARTSDALVRKTLEVSAAGLGAALASVVALLLCLLEIVTTPSILLGIVIAGSALRLWVEARKAGDDNFPPAPGEVMPPGPG